MFTARARLFLLFFGFDNLAAFEVTAIWTHTMRHAQFTAIAAYDQVGTCQSIVSAAAVTASRGMLPFWLWGHRRTPIYFFARNLPCSTIGLVLNFIRIPAPLGRLGDYTCERSDCQVFLGVRSESMYRLNFQYPYSICMIYLLEKTALHQGD